MSRSAQSIPPYPLPTLSPRTSPSKPPSNSLAEVEECTYPKNSYTPDYTRILWGSQGTVCAGEITLWCCAARIGFLDYDALLFRCHLVVSFVSSTRREGRNWIVRGCDVVVWRGREKLSESSRNFFAPGDDAKSLSRDLPIGDPSREVKGRRKVVSV